MSPALAAWIAKKNGNDDPRGKRFDGPGARRNDKQDPPKKKHKHHKKVLSDKLKKLQGSK